MLGSLCTLYRRVVKGLPCELNRSSLTCQGIVREASISSLRSGHSHEDMDQVFGRLSRYMITHGQTCLTPNDFRSVISDFLQQAQFPFEPASARHAIKIDQTRDWLLVIALQRNFG